MRDVPGKYEGLSDSSYGYRNMVALAPYDLSRPMLALRRLGVRPAPCRPRKLTDFRLKAGISPSPIPRWRDIPYADGEKQYGICHQFDGSGNGRSVYAGFYDEDAPDLLLAQDPQAYYAGFFARVKRKLRFPIFRLLRRWRRTIRRHSPNGTAHRPHACRCECGADGQ